MDQRTVVLVGGAIIILALLPVLAYSVGLQRRAVGQQRSAVSKVDESLSLSREVLALSRESVQLQKQALNLLQESISLQREANTFLAAIARGRSPSGDVRAAEQPDAADEVRDGERIRGPRS